MNISIQDQMCVFVGVSTSGGGGFGVCGRREMQQNVIQGFTTMHYYLTSPLLTRREDIG